MNLRWIIGVPLAVFGVGIAVGYAARQRGVPQDQVGRWTVKEIVRAGLRAHDAVVDILPDDDPIPLADALNAPPPPFGRSGKGVPS